MIKIEATTQQCAKTINKRIGELFKPKKQGARWWITCNKSTVTNGYNFYFWRRRPHTWTRSWPLVDCNDCSLDECIAIIRGVRKQWEFTIEYVNFDKNEMWQLKQSLGRDM